MTNQIVKGLGYKHDPSVRFKQYGKTASALSPLRFAAADLSPFVRRVRDQGNTGSCVGQALAAAIEICRGAAGAPTDVSARWLYAIAREREHPDGKAPLSDDGTYPALACEAARGRGIVNEASFPFDVEAINARPSPSLSTLAYDARGLEWTSIDAVGEERIAAIEDALRRGFGVMFAMDVDRAYQDDDGPAVVDRMGASIGGHMQTITAVWNSGVRVLNSWGPAWRDGGSVLFDRAYFATAPLRSLLVIREVPRAA